MISTKLRSGCSFQSANYRPGEPNFRGNWPNCSQEIPSAAPGRSTIFERPGAPSSLLLPLPLPATPPLGHSSSEVTQTTPGDFNPDELLAAIKRNLIIVSPRRGMLQAYALSASNAPLKSPTADDNPCRRIAAKYVRGAESGPAVTYARYIRGNPIARARVFLLYVYACVRACAYPGLSRSLNTLLNPFRAARPLIDKIKEDKPNAAAEIHNAGSELVHFALSTWRGSRVTRSETLRYE